MHSTNYLTFNLEKDMIIFEHLYCNMMLSERNHDIDSNFNKFTAIVRSFAMKIFGVTRS